MIKAATNQLIAIMVLLTLNSCAFIGMATSEQGFKIAVLAPLSGPGAVYGRPFVEGLQMAIDDTNSESGLNRTQVDLVVEDTKLDPKTSLESVQKLLAFDDPDLFSVMFAPPALAVGPVLDNAKKPFIYEAYIRSPLNLSYAFKANFDALSGCESLVQYAKTHSRYKRLGVLMANTEYSELCIQGIKKIEPGIKEYRYTFGDTDFRSALIKAYSDGVDSLMIVGFDFEYVAVFKQLSEIGYPIKILCTTSSECIIPEVEKSSSKKVLEGTLSIDFVPQNISTTPFGKAYTDRYRLASPTDLAYAAVGYEEGIIISEAMRSCKPKDSACLKESIENVKGYKSVLESNGFRDRILQMKTKIYEYKNDSWMPAGE